MYESFYNLDVNPFRLAPDPKFCFSHPSYDEAHAYLEYAFKLGEGFVIFTGRPGTGKTTLIRAFLNRLDVTQIVAAKVAVTNMNAADLLRSVAYAFDIDIADLDMAAVLRRVEQYFARQVLAGKRSLLIIDEAQGLSRSALEELRMLADLQTESRFLLQIFLVGHEKLREFMVSPEMEQFQQRVTGTCKLRPLNQQESRDYIEYRLCQVGWSGDPELTGTAVSAIYQYSGGIPRHINKICTRLLLHGLLEEKHVLEKDDVLAVAEDLKDELLAPLFTQQTAVEAGTADLAIRACSAPVKSRPQTKIAKPDIGAGVERKTGETGSNGSRTYVHGEGKEKASLVANRNRQSVEPDVVFSVLAALLLFLVVLVFNGEEDDKDKGLLASSDDAYATWGQVSRNRASRSAMADQQQKDTGQPAIDASEPGPELIAEVSVSNATSEMAFLGAVSDVIQPTIVQQSEVVEPPPAIRKPGQTRVAVIEKHEVARLLSLAQKSLNDSRLLVPSDHNAYEYYRQVDTLDPGNKEAARGFGLIVDRYFTLAEKAISRNDEKMAILYINRGLHIHPGNGKLLALQTALMMQKVEPVDDVPIQEVPIQQVAVQEPSSGDKTLFARLKDMITRDQVGTQDDPIWHDEDYEW